MKKILGLFALVTAAALFTGCASGPKYSTIKSTFPPLAQDSGRIYFYRNSILGAAVQPAVKLNGNEVGTAKADGFFYVDRPAGNFTVETSTEVTRRLSLMLDTNQTRYVKLNISMGFFVGHVYPELVDNVTGEKEIIECKYTGGK